LLIAFALACAEFSGVGGVPVGIDVEGHGRDEELAAGVDLSRVVGWFTTLYPVALSVGGVDWGQVLAGEAALGGLVKDAKEQLRALPDPLTYGLLRYVNPRWSWPDRLRCWGSIIWAGWARRQPSCLRICGASVPRVCR